MMYEIKERVDGIIRKACIHLHFIQSGIIGVALSTLYYR